MVTEFWKQSLHGEETEQYDKLVIGFSRQNEKISIDTRNPQAFANSFLEIQSAVINDHPELFWVSPQCSLEQRSVGMLFSPSVKLTVINDFVFDRREIDAHKRTIDGIVAALLRETASIRDEFEKIIYVAEYLVKNTVYEIDNMLNQNAAAALCNKKAQCSGVARAFKLILDAMGIYCIVVSGTGFDNNRHAPGPHAWNIVRVGTKYYHVDVTFMMGANTPGTSNPRRMFLFYDDNENRKNHEWDLSTVPACTDASHMYNGTSGMFGGTGAFGQRGTTGGMFGQQSNASGASGGSGYRSPAPKPAGGNPNAPHYRSLSEFKTALSGALNERKTSMEFYLEGSGFDSAQAISSAVQNACRMVFQRANIAISCSIQINSGDMLVALKLEYK